MKSNKRILSFFTFSILLILGEFALAQNEEFRGRVLDTSGESLPGVNIIIKGTTQGTITNLDGEFTLRPTSLPESPLLVFSFLGFKKQEVALNSSVPYEIVLIEDNQMIDELIVIGYEIQKKSDLTGAVSEINSEVLTQSPVAGIDQALQGKAAGVNVTQSTGAPGEGVSVRIRGIGSINSDNAPLYIVDGVPTQDALSSISPGNIESISILKDAASAAIYGSRANNGVVIITTKKGKAGEMSVSFNSTYGLQKHGRLTPMTNTADYVEIYNEAAVNDNALIANPRLHRPIITDELAADLPDVDHMKEIFRLAQLNNTNLSISGGNEKTQYRLSGNYFNQEGIIINSDYERFGGALSLNTQVNDWLKVGTNFNISQASNAIIGSSGDGYGGNGGSVVRYALFRTPALPVFNQDNDYYDYPDRPDLYGDGYNPVGLAANTSNLRKERRLFGDLNATIQFSPKLSFTSTYGLDLANTNQRRFSKIWGTNNRINNPNTLNVTNGDNSTWSWSNTLNYRQTFNDIHQLSGVLGTEAIHGQGYTFSSSEKDFADQNPNLVYLGNGQGATTSNESKWAYSLLSFFGRMNYSYNSKYLFSITLREDGSSRFASGNKWGTFYSGSAGWRIDQESFLAEVDAISILKLRAGMGFIGNQNVGYYAYSDRIGSQYNYPFGNVSYDGSAQSVLGNQDIKWETSQQFDGGIDLGLLDGRLNFSFDYFHKVTKDMLTQEPIPSSGGYAQAAWVNNGEVLNNGFEMEMNFKQKLGDFNFDITGNLATLHNEVLDLKSPILGGRIDNGIYATKTEIGHSVGAFYLYEMVGIFQNQLEIVTSAYQSDNVLPGDIRYKDQNNDGKITELDRTFVGSPIPDLNVGLNLAMQYKQFDASLFFQGAFGHEIYYQVATDIEGFYRPFNVTQRYFDERWTGEGSSNTQPRASWNGKANNTKPSTRFLENGSYLRLKNLQVGYSFSDGMLEKLNMKACRIFFSGSNLMTVTNYVGLDPEMTTSDNSKSEGDRASGIDWGTYPSAISYNFGVQLTF